jgi:hypothetical protein
MALLSRDDMLGALRRLGELASAAGQDVDLLLVGGGVMVVEFNTRPSTRDLDVVILNPAPHFVRQLANVVASERGWTEDWLNDAVKGFLIGWSPTSVVLTAPGITVCRPSIEQLLA